MNIDDIREFDPMTMKEIGNSAIWYAPSSGGKTISCTHVLSKVGKWYDEIYLFSKTAHCQTGAFKFIPKKYKYDDLALDKIEAIMQQQKDRIDENEHRKKHGRKEKKVPNVCIIFDDIITCHKLRHSGIIDTLSTLGRHVKCAFYLLSQCASKKFSVNKAVRSNVRFCFAAYLRSEADRNTIVEEYLSVNNKKEGLELFRAITKVPFQYCVIDLEKSVNAQKLSDYVFKYKVPENVPHFEVGSEDWWADDETRSKIKFNPKEVVSLPDAAPDENMGVETMVREDLIYGSIDVKTDYQPCKNDVAPQRKKKKSKRIVQKVIYHL